MNDEPAVMSGQHIRAILDELRSDVDTAFSNLDNSPTSQSGRRDVLNAVINYLDTARTLLFRLAQIRERKQPFNIHKRSILIAFESNSDNATQLEERLRPPSWEQSISGMFVPATIFSRVETQEFSPSRKVSNDLATLASARARLLAPRTPSSLQITKQELLSASRTITWVHAKAHELLMVASESPAQELERRLKLRDLYDLKIFDQLHGG